MNAKSTPSVSQAIMERLKALDDLPHFPDALSKLEKSLLNGNIPDLGVVSQIIVQDPRLTAGIIGVANSAKYSSGMPISDLSEAVSRIGIKDVRLMAHAINYKASFKSKPPFSEKQFLRHSLLSAFIAQDLAAVVHLNPGEMFLSALMKDLGVYLLAVESREGYKQVIQNAMGDMDAVLKAESVVFAVQHPILSARLLKHWQFSNEIVMGVASHHAPHKAKPEFQAHAYLVYLAEMGAIIQGEGNGVISLGEDGYDPFENDTLQAALDYLGISESRYNQALETAMGDLESMSAI